MFEEFESYHDRSGRPDNVMGQSTVLMEIKTVLRQYEERIELLSQENKVSKFCMDAGFQSVVEIGQYFMIHDTGEQFVCSGLS